jgi:hypothetical protein
MSNVESEMQEIYCASQFLNDTSFFSSHPVGAPPSCDDPVGSLADARKLYWIINVESEMRNIYSAKRSTNRTDFERHVPQATVGGLPVLDRDLHLRRHRE